MIGYFSKREHRWAKERWLDLLGVDDEHQYRKKRKILQIKKQERKQ